jgi:SAM-dependent methyltransferase
LPQGVLILVGLPYGKLLSARSYAEVLSEAEGFEAVCTKARHQMSLKFLQAAQSATILEVGCGPLLLSDLLAARLLGFRRWAVVEPAPDYAARSAAATKDDPRFSVVEGYLEACEEQLHTLCPEGYDAVLVAGLVHETTDPLTLLKSAALLLRPGGSLLVSAPNALSFHRLLAVECGLIETPHQLSERDIQLGHPCVFDAASLKELVESAGLTATSSGGYLFKPFTNAQMHSAIKQFGDHLIDGLIGLGMRFPANAAEIYVIAGKP